MSLSVRQAMLAKARERSIINNFLGSLDPHSTLDEAMANAERDARAYGLSRAAARSLGQQIRARFAQRAGGAS